jgi:hypothetical protein
MNAVLSGIGLLLAVWVFLWFVDVLDAWTCRITPEAAARRVRSWMQHP